VNVQTVETHHDPAVGTGPAGAGATVAQLSVRLAVVEREPLVASTVRRALETRGVDVTLVPWSGDGDEAQVRRGVAAAHADRVLLMSPLSPWPLLRDAQALVLGSTEHWLLLSVTPPGPAWGAMLDAGVEAVLPSSTGLDDTVTALERSTSGLAVMDPALEARLRQEWHGMTTELALMRLRLDRLSPRETQVLERLYDGDVVRQVADNLGVTQHTVRTQVKSVMRKLEVNTQLAAVAVFGWVKEHPLAPGDVR
jgi:two-component system, NarL family, nitrate/nitrite response regulator NarL